VVVLFSERIRRKSTAEAMKASILLPLPRSDVPPHPLTSTPEHGNDLYDFS